MTWQITIHFTICFIIIIIIFSFQNVCMFFPTKRLSTLYLTYVYKDILYLYHLATTGFSILLGVIGKKKSENSHM